MIGTLRRPANQRGPREAKMAVRLQFCRGQKRAWQYWRKLVHRSNDATRGRPIPLQPPSLSSRPELVIDLDTLDNFAKRQPHFVSAAYALLRSFCDRARCQRSSSEPPGATPGARALGCAPRAAPSATILQSTAPLHQQRFWHGFWDMVFKTNRHFCELRFRSSSKTRKTRRLKKHWNSRI